MKKAKRFLSILAAAAAVIIGITMVGVRPVKADGAINPIPLALDGNYVGGTIANKGEADFYKITLTSAGYLTVVYQGFSIGDSYCYVLSEHQDKEYAHVNLSTSSATNPITQSMNLAMEPGTYIIKVTGYGNHTGDYRLNASFEPAGNNESNNNDTFETAQALSPNAPVKGFLSEDDRIDFFRINLADRQRIRLIYTSYIKDSYVDIYNQNFENIMRKNICFADRNNPKVYIFEDTLDPGVYYIKVTPYGSYCGAYTIEYQQKVMAASISIQASKKNVAAGQTLSLTAVVSPSNATDQAVKWRSSDTRIAGVNEDTGKVMTYLPGVVKITALAQDGSDISQSYTLIVKPKKMSKPSLANTRSGQMTVRFFQSGVKGYQVQYGTNGNFKKAKKKSTSRTSLTIKKLTKNKKYYVRVRAYIKSGGKYYYGAWSSKKSIKIRR